MRVPVPTLLCSLALFGCTKDEPAEQDAAPMDLTLVSPAQADWLPAGVVKAHGTAPNAKVVRINGADAMHVPGGQGVFEGELLLERGINVVEVDAVDARGDRQYVRHGVLAGDFADPNQPVADAMALRLNQGGIDQLMGLVGRLISVEDMADMAIGMNPVYQDSYGVFGWDAVTISADITGLAMDTPIITAQPVPGQMDLEVRLPQVDVDLRAYGDVVGLDFDTSAEITADEAIITAALLLDADDGALVIELEDISVELAGFAYDTSLLPGDVESWLFVDTVREQVEGMLLEQIETQVPALLDSALGGLDPSFSTELMGQELSLSAGFAEAGVDSQGIVLGLDLDAHMQGDGSQSYKGYLATQGGEPTVSKAADMGLAIHDDLLNRLLFEAWKGGLLNMRLSTDDGSLDAFMLIPLKAEAGTITVSAGLPPVLIERDGRSQLQVGELQVDIETPGGEMGEFMSLGVAAYVDVALEVENSALGVDLGEVELDLMVRASDWGGSNETMTQLVEEMLPIDTLLLLVGALEFDLPSIYGLQFDSAEVARDASGAHTSVKMSLGQTPE